jgi:uncharacterized iron-regulated protein
MITKFVLFLSSVLLLGTQQAPQDARRELLKAWERHTIVAVAEIHRAVEDKDFLLTLIRDAEFSQRVNDIAVEFGNARLQPLLDRYMEGAAVSQAELRQVWRDTTVANGVWDAPVYEQFFAAVRAHNQTLPANRRLRVIGCDPPIDWQQVKTFADAAPSMARDSFCASVLEREVIAKGRKALLIMGDGHVTRRHLTGSPLKNAVTLFEAKHPGAVFVALTYFGQYKDSASIEEQLGGGGRPIPSVSLLRTSPIGKMAATTPKPLTRTRVGPTAAPVTETIVVTDPPRFEDVADALLYLGPKSMFTRSIPSAEAFSPEELRELERRHELLYNSPLDRKMVFQ